MDTMMLVLKCVRNAMNYVKLVRLLQLNVYHVMKMNKLEY